jgi:predicted nucleotidyltransferase
MDERIRMFCKKWNIKEFSLFGSYITKNFNQDSDVDVLVSFDEKAVYGFFELVDMKAELEVIYGRKVDLVTKRAVENSRNHIRSTGILRNTKLVYAE